MFPSETSTKFKITKEHARKRKHFERYNEGSQKPIEVSATDVFKIEVKNVEEKKPCDEFVTPKRKKIRKKKSQEKVINGIQLRVDEVCVDQPKINNQEIRNLVAKLWSKLGNAEKAEKKPESQNNDENNKSIDNRNNNNVIKKSSSRCVEPAFVSMKKGEGLFSGTNHEKVCQLCLKPGKTVKCNGLCGGVFHLNCIANSFNVQSRITEIKCKRGRKNQVRLVKSDGNCMKTRNELQCFKSSHVLRNSEKIKRSRVSAKAERTGESCENNESQEFWCKTCLGDTVPECFLCGLQTDLKSENCSKVCCAIAHCEKFYHPECLKAWPQTSHNEDRQTITCPRHVCHTCASDDPRNATVSFRHERLVQCVLCPTSYHTGNYCVPAGSEILTGRQIVCPKHYVPQPRVNHHVNAGWCFICSKGGLLICCEFCPTSFHAECLTITPPDGGYICGDCDTGRFPLHGEVVWAKLGAYRWWPAQILFPHQIPVNVKNVRHVRGEFAVRFFGTHNYSWLNRGRVFLYQEGDKGHKYTKKTSIDNSFQSALSEALEAYKRIKVERSLWECKARQSMKPPTFVHIKSNRPVGSVHICKADHSSLEPCECDPNSDHPCGFDSDCINRIMLVECTPTVCPAGSRCRNQCFIKKIYPPLEPVRTETRGWGLKTLKDLYKGEFIIEYVGEVIDEKEYQKRLESKLKERDHNYYFLTLDKDYILDAGPKGNVARFMNHSCQPNCETQKWTVNGETRIGIFALQDIPAGEELTFHYNMERADNVRKLCLCGASNCSGFIGLKVQSIQKMGKN